MKHIAQCEKEPDLMHLHVGNPCFQFRVCGQSGKVKRTIPTPARTHAIIVRDWVHVFQASSWHVLFPICRIIHIEREIPTMPLVYDLVMAQKVKFRSFFRCGTIPSGNEMVGAARVHSLAENFHVPVFHMCPFGCCCSSG